MISGISWAVEFEFSDWQVSRSRYGQGDMVRQTVNASLVIKNSSQIAIENAEARLVFMTAMGEVIRESKWMSLGSLNAGNNKILKVKEGLLPVFACYEVQVKGVVQNEPVKLCFHSADAFSLPQLVDEKLSPGIVDLRILGQEYSSIPGKKKTNDYLLLRLKNFGEIAAEGTVVEIRFFDKKGNKLETCSLPLGKDAILGGQEKTFKLPLNPKNKSFNHFKIFIQDASSKKSAEERLSGGEFSREKVLEVAQFKFTREEKKLNVHFKLRNGTMESIDKLVMKLNFYGKGNDKKAVLSHKILLKGIKAAEVREISEVIDKCPDYESFDYVMETNIEVPAEVKKTKRTFPEIEAKVPEGSVGASLVELKESSAGVLLFKANIFNHSQKDITNMSVIFELVDVKMKLVKHCEAGVDQLQAGERISVSTELENPPEFYSYRYSIRFE